MRYPLKAIFPTATSLPLLNTHLAAPPARLRLPIRFDPAFDPRRTEFLTRMVERWGDLEGTFFNQPSRYLYGYVERMIQECNLCSDQGVWSSSIPSSGR